ncbi:hypothetical protein IFM47457_08449 [Aspergillus lentulus]|nr:hypothetical protein IFM47457_08449 [Aspergillus lentulus]
MFSKRKHLRNKVVVVQKRRNEARISQWPKLSKAVKKVHSRWYVGGGHMPQAVVLQFFLQLPTSATWFLSLIYQGTIFQFTIYNGLLLFAVGSISHLTGVDEPQRFFAEAATLLRSGSGRAYVPIQSDLICRRSLSKWRLNEDTWVEVRDADELTSLPVSCTRGLFTGSFLSTAPL